ncbi:MAG TPA: copper homeostasis protein CutC, partial [Saprospiraceae bacterium]|nr:copper homeostasis protein CutC [Saprospiraceae bacterium]
AFGKIDILVNNAGYGDMVSIEECSDDHFDEVVQVNLTGIFRFCREAGVAGVVVGALNSDGDLDVGALEALRDAAGPLHLTCHRAFDYTRSPFEALETLIALGFVRVLSSGQATTAFEGRFLLKDLVEKAGDRITIMPGAGISPKNIHDIASVTGAREFHLTGRKKTVQPNPGGDIPGLEWWYWESSEAVIRATIAAV